MDDYTTRLRAEVLASLRRALPGTAWAPCSEGVVGIGLRYTVRVDVSETYTDVNAYGRAPLDPEVVLRAADACRETLYLTSLDIGDWPALDLRALGVL